MASQVYSGTGNFTYTNNTGQNVRVIINYLSSTNSKSYPSIDISWGSTSSPVTASTYGGAGKQVIGRNLAYQANYGTGTGAVISANGALDVLGGFDETILVAPTELILAPGHIFSATARDPVAITAYNIVVIPEAG